MNVEQCHQVSKLGRVDLLVQGGNAKARDSDQLKHGTREIVAFPVTVDQVYGQVQRTMPLNRASYELDFD